MRLILSCGSWSLLDIEVLALKRMRDEDEMIVRIPLEDSERSEPMEPDTIAFGFNNA